MFSQRPSLPSQNRQNDLFADLEHDVVITVIAKQVLKKRFRNYVKTELGRTLIGRTPPMSPDLNRIPPNRTVFSRVPGRPSPNLLNIETEGKSAHPRPSPGFHRTGSLPQNDLQGVFKSHKKWVSPFQTRDITILRKIRSKAVSPRLSIIANQVSLSPQRTSPGHARSASKQSHGEQFVMSPFLNSEDSWRPGKPLGGRLRLQTIRKIRGKGELL